jgi:hypothetical protein
VFQLHLSDDTQLMPHQRSTRAEWGGEQPQQTTKNQIFFPFPSIIKQRIDMEDGVQERNLGASGGVYVFLLSFSLL